MTTEGNVRWAIDHLKTEAHATAKDKGFWDAPRREFPETIALIHSELSEALEAYRRDDVPGMEEELADALIRIFDAAEAYELDVAEALMNKMARNKSRPNMHGKRC